MLKSQDVVVALKIAAVNGEAWTYAMLGSSLGMSPSNVHRSVQRACMAGLLAPDGRRPIRAALIEFLLHGARYAFPPKRGRATRGMPTASSAPPLSERLVSASELPPVWPDADGTVRGESLAPLHASVPGAAAQDAKLYALLAVADALRVGGAREREVAEVALRELLER